MKFRALEWLMHDPDDPHARWERAFPVKPDEVHLRLIKTHDDEVICDQDGRSLSGVIGFRYEQTEHDSAPILIVKLVVEPSGWSRKLGVREGGKPVKLEPSGIKDEMSDP